MGAPCPDCGGDDYGYVKCPNKHIFHASCITEWALYESYCVKCNEELIDIECTNIVHVGKKNPHINGFLLL